MQVALSLLKDRVTPMALCSPPKSRPSTLWCSVSLWTIYQHKAGFIEIASHSVTLTCDRYYCACQFRWDAWIADCSGRSLRPARTERVLAVGCQPSPRPQIPQSKICPHLSKRGPLGGSIKSERVSHDGWRRGALWCHRGTGVCEIRIHQPIRSDSGLSGPIILLITSSKTLPCTVPVDY